jgi:hypothetical protein
MVAGNRRLFAEDSLLGRVARWVAPFVNRLMGKSDSFIDALIPAINLYKGIPTDFFARQVYFKSHQEKPEHAEPDGDQSSLPRLHGGRQKCGRSAEHHCTWAPWYADAPGDPEASD